MLSICCGTLQTQRELQPKFCPDIGTDRPRGYEKLHQLHNEAFWGSREDFSRWSEKSLERMGKGYWLGIFIVGRGELV